MLPQCICAKVCDLINHDSIIHSLIQPVTNLSLMHCYLGLVYHPLIDTTSN